MLDSSNNIRTAYLNLLNGHLSLNDKNVPVYGNDTFTTTPKAYVIIGSISESSDNNNQQFVSNVDVTLDIFCEQYREYDNASVDNIASQILTLLLPTTGIHDIGDAYFQIFALSRISSNYVPLNDGQNFIARKVITINNLIIQK